MAKRIVRHSNVQGEDSRQRILSATLEIASRRGYEGTTIAQVTAATGLTAGSIHWHFRNKDQLLGAVVQYGYQQLLGVTHAWNEMPAAGASRDQIHQQLRAASYGLHARPEVWRMGLMLALESPEAGGEARIGFLRIRGEALDRIATWWRGFFAARSTAVAPDSDTLMAQLTLATMDGLFVAGHAEEGLEIDAVIRMLAAGLDATAARILAGGGPATTSSDTLGPLPRRTSTDDSSRTKIVQAATAIAVERGYHGTTISQICRQAGLPASSLYWHFKDKNELMAAVVESSYAQWADVQPRLLPIIAAGSPWPDEMRTATTARFRSVVEHPNFLRIGLMFLLERRGTPTAGRTLFVGIRRRLRLELSAWFEEIVAESGVDENRTAALADQLAVLVTAISDGLFFSHDLDVLVWQLHDFVDLIVDVFQAAIQDQRSG